MNRKHLRSLILAIGLSVFGMDPIWSQPAYEGWGLKAPLLATNSEIGVAELDGKIYVIGGYPADRKTVATVQMYDSRSNRWQFVAPLPVPLMYDPKSDRWTKLPNMRTQRNHLAAGAFDGKVYVFGGRFGGGFQSEKTDAVEVFEPKTQQWSKRKPLLKPRGGVNGIFANGCFHLFGGEGNPDHPYHVFADHDYYNPVTDTWHQLGPMPIAVHGVTGLAFIDGLIHLPGGGTAQGGSSGSTIHQTYKPAMSCK